MNKTKITKSLPIILAVVALALTATTFAAITTTQNLPSSGTIITSPNLAVYSDSACTTPLTSVSWGSIAPGGTVTQTVYIKNTGTGAMSGLSITSSAWSPSNANNYITVSWDKQGSSLNAGQSSAAVITLSVSSSITGITNFSNTITLTGTG